MDQKLDYEYENGFDERPFTVSNKLLLSAGPTNCSERVLRAVSLPTLIPVSSELYKMMAEIKELMQYVFQTKNTLTFLHQSSGTGGIEMAIVNLLERGDTVLVAVSGLWGERTVSKAERAGMKVASLRAEPGEVFALHEIEAAIVQHKPALLSVTHAESVGGTLQPLEGIAAVCRKHNCLFLVDAVISLGTDPLFVDRWGIDVAISATQKGLGAPPGMSLLTFSPRAEERVFSRKSPVPFYSDIGMIADYWGCRGNPQRYCYTYSSNLVAGVREALMQVAEEGLLNAWDRHRRCSERFWRGLDGRGFQMLVKDPKHRSHAVTPVALPKGYQWRDVLAYLDKKYAVEIGFGMGPSKDMIRVGFMNINSRPTVVDYFLKVLFETLDHLKPNA